MKKFFLFLLVVTLWGCSDENREKAYNYFGRGNTLMEGQQYSQAIDEFKLALQYDSKMYAAYNLMGNCYDYLGNYEEAIKCYNASNDITENAYAMNNLGNAYCNKGQYQKAIEYYEKSVDLDPKYASPLYNMGKAYLALNNESEGLKYIEKAAALTHRGAREFLKSYGK